MSDRISGSAAPFPAIVPASGRSLATLTALFAALVAILFAVWRDRRRRTR